MPTLSQTLASPGYAAAIAGLVALLVMYIDHRINKIEDKTSDYLKFIGFTSTLVFAIVYSITNNNNVKSFGGRSQFNIMNEPF